MPLTTLNPLMTSGLLQSANRLSELGASASAQEATQNNIGVNTAVPIGVVLPFASPTIPQGWLLCAGQSVSRSTYADLFTVIGTTYGPGDGSTTFDLPDLRGRAVAGRDNMNGTTAGRLSTAHFGATGLAIGQSGGSEGQALTAAQLASHSHFVANTDSTTNTSPSLGAAQTLTTSNIHSNLDPNYTLNGSATAATVGLSSSTGSGSAHNNVQPTMILNYIIKAKFVSAVAVP